MLNLNELESMLSEQNFNIYRPQQRDELLNTYLTLLVCKELVKLNENIESLKNSLEVVNQSNIPVVNKPGRKPKEEGK